MDKEDLKLEIRKYGIPAIRTMREVHCEVVSQLLARAADRIEQLEKEIVRLKRSPTYAPGMRRKRI